jgi:AraC-like DNA-binding protein
MLLLIIFELRMNNSSYSGLPDNSVFYGKKWKIPVLENIYPFHFLGIVILIYWTGYKVLHQPLLFGGEVPETFLRKMPQLVNIPEPLKPDIREEQENTKPVKINPALVKELEQKLFWIMEQEKIYLSSELTIQDVAEKLNTNKQYISEILNRSFHKNFYDYVNDYRIEEFKKLISQPGSDRMNILGLAYEAGFNAKATFNAVFKKKTGLTPSQFIRQQVLNPSEIQV